jgi:DNA-binding MarR family transcriptional regulator
MNSPDGVVLALHRASHMTLHVLGARLAGLGLSASEINALASLARQHPAAVGALAAATATRPTTLTSVLDRLERRGHITRGPRAGDRRSVVIELTDSGHATAAVITQTLTDLEARTLGRLPRQAIAGFYAVLDALTKEGS